MADEDSVPGVVVDVDGTLLDTNYLHVVAWIRALRSVGFEHVTMAEVHGAIGIASHELVRYLTGSDDEKLVDEASEAHGREYEAFQDDIRALPGAADLLRACRDAGRRVVIATSGKKDDLDWMLPAIGVEKDVIAGATTSADVEEAKPAPDLIGTAMRAHGLDPERSLALGDTVWDVQAAARAGVPCVAFRSGGIGEAELRDAGAVEVWGTPKDLVEHLSESRVGFA